MGRIFQTQRPAIDSVIDIADIRPFVLRAGQSYFLNGKQVFPLQVSWGIGTCTDPKFRNINIIVLAEEPINCGEVKTLEFTQCHGAVLRRKRKENEFDQEIDEKLIPDCLAIDWLEIEYEDFGSRQIFLKFSGKSKLYVPLVS